MTPTTKQQQAIANAWKMLSSVFPNMHGSIKFNLNPEIGYINMKFTVEQALHLKPDGTVIGSNRK